MILKCEVCGGEINEVDENLMGKCPYCQTINIVSKNKDRIQNLLNRATFLRQNNEFSKAIEVYEEVLKEDNDDAAAHWGLLLSKYGIEFIYDEKTGRTMANCHCLRENSIMEDVDYIQAINNANIEQKYIYEREAREINELYEKMYRISKEMAPFDIFISYKESDGYGNRTVDSVEAQNIYDKLTEKGYNVFFSRKTLENCLGKEYEPIIYTALRTSKVMILVSTKAENINSVWVKNEWTRYLEMMKEDKEKYIIPCYKDMSPYELPMELSKIQSLDILKIGFMQDLTDGIEKIINKTKAKTPAQGGEILKDVDYLYDKAMTYKKMSDNTMEYQMYNQMTNKYPADYRGWWGKVVMDTKNFTEGYSNFYEIERNANRAMVVCENNERKKIEAIWAKYYNEYKKEEYNNILDRNYKKREDYENKINEIENQINGFEDYSVEKSECIRDISEMERATNTLKYKSDSHKKRAKRVDNVISGIAFVWAAICVIFCIAVIIEDGGQGIGSTIFTCFFAFAIVEAVIIAIGSAIEAGMDKVLDVSEKSIDNKAINVNEQIDIKKSELQEINCKMQEQEEVRKFLEEKKTALNELNEEINRLIKEGFTEYKAK